MHLQRRLLSNSKQKTKSMRKWARSATKRGLGGGGGTTDSEIMAGGRAADGAGGKGEAGKVQSKLFTMSQRLGAGVA